MMAVLRTTMSFPLCSRLPLIAQNAGTKVADVDYLLTTNFGGVTQASSPLFFLKQCRIFNFSTTTLTVRIYKADEFVINDDASLTPASTDISQAPTLTNDRLLSNTTTCAKSKRKQEPAYDSRGTRQSKRIRADKVHYDERKFSEVSNDTTVLDLKLKASLLSAHDLLLGILYRSRLSH